MGSLLVNQSAVSSQFPMPVTDATQTYRITDVAGESVQFIVASTNVNDAGSDAGTVVYARLTNTGVLDSMKNRVGSYNDTSFSFGTGTVLTTLRQFDFSLWEMETNDAVSRATRLANLAANFSNGQYAIDHRTGLIVGKKATVGTSDTASYSYKATVGGAGGGDATAANQTTQIGLETTIASAVRAEDSASSSGQNGIVILAIRNDAGTALAADQDYSWLQVDSTGALRVTTSGATGVADDSAFTVGTSTVQPIGYFADESATDSVDENDVGAARMTLNRRQIMSSETADDAAPETGTKVSLTGAVFDDATPDSVDENDAGYVRMSANRNLYSTIRDAAGNERGANVNAANQLAVVESATQADDAAFTPATSRVMMMGAEADETGTDSVDEGDGGALRMTLNRRLINAGHFIDDAAYGVATDYVNASGYLADDTATDSVNEGDIGIARMSLDRKVIAAGSYVDDTAFTPAGANSYVVLMAGEADETSTDSVDEGDAGALRMTLDRRLITAGQILDDAAFGIATSYVTPIGFLADETATDSVNEGDVGAARITLTRKQINASEYVDDTAVTPAAADTYTMVIGALADMTAPDAVDEGDIGMLRMDLSRNLQVSMATQLDDTNDSVNAVPKMKATGTGMTFLASTITTMTNTEIAVKTSGGQLGGWSFANRAAADTYVQWFNDTTTTVVPGTTVPQMVTCVPASGGQNQEFFGSMPLTFATAITVFASTSRTASSAPATALEVNGIYGI